MAKEKSKPGNSSSERPKMVSTKPIFDKLGIGPDEAQRMTRNFYWEMDKMHDEIELEQVLNQEKLTPEEIWSIKPNSFYAWRKKYDLPRILKHFSEKLSRFNEWKEIFGIDDDFLINHGISICVRLKHFGDKDKYIYLFQKRNGEQLGSDILSEIDLSNKKAERFGETETYIFKKKFKSYLEWCEEQNVRAFKNRPNDRIFDVSSASNIDSDDIKVYILDDLELLKIGGIKVNPNGVGLINTKYFEFVNGCRLTFEGKYSSAGLVLRFENSIIDNLRCQKLDFQLVEFNNCSLVNLLVEDSLIAQWGFYKTTVTGKITNSKLSMVNIVGGVFNPVLDSTYFDHVEANHINELHFASTYQLLKKIYADQGDDKNAIRYFLVEKRLERAGYYDSIFRQRVHTVFKVSWFKRSFLVCLLTIKVFALWLFSLINDYYWGYGRQPFKIVGSALICIFVCAIFYYLNSDFMNLPYMQTKFSISDSIYYSTITFTTLGYGDFTPKGFLRIVASFEALFGGMSIGFLVAGFANLKY